MRDSITGKPMPHVVAAAEKRRLERAAKRIRLERKRAGLNRDELAEATGVSKGTIMAIERTGDNAFARSGENSGALSWLVVARFLEIDLSTLFE